MLKVKLKYIQVLWTLLRVLLAAFLLGLPGSGRASPYSGPDLQVEKRLVDRHFYAGMQATYRLDFANRGDQTAAGVVLTDTLPAGASLLTTYGVIHSPEGSAGLPDPVISGQTISWAIGDLPPEWLGLVDVSVQIDPSLAAGSVLTNTWQASIPDGESNPLDNRISLANTIEPPIPDLAVEKTILAPGVLDPGYSAEYRLTWINQGTSIAGDVVLTDTLPAELLYSSSDILSAPAGSDPAEFSLQGNTLTWKLGDLKPGWQGAIRVIAGVPVDAVEGELLVNRFDASHSLGELNIANNHAELNLPVLPRHPELQVNKYLGYPGLFQGVEGRYILHFRNHLGQVPAPGAWLTDTLPLSVTLLSTSGILYSGELTRTLPAPQVTGQTLTWSLGDLPPNSHGDIQVRVRVKPDTPVGSALTNRAWISEYPYERNVADNSSSTTNLVRADAPDLMLSHEYLFPNTFPGSLVDFFWDISNNGSQPAEGVVLTQTLPSGLSFISGSGRIYPFPYTGTVTFLPPPDVEGNLLIWKLGRMDTGSSGNISLTFQLDADLEPGAELSGAAEVFPDSGEIYLEDNRITYTIRIQSGNLAPLALDQELQTLEDEPLAGVLSASDPGEVAPLSYWAFQPPGHGLLQVDQDGRFTYTPEPDFYGQDRFLFRVYDSSFASDLGQVSIQVLPVDDPPQVVNFSLTIPQFSPLNLSQAGFLGHYLDPDGPPLLSVRFESLPQHGRLLLDGKALPAGLDLPLDRLDGLIYLPRLGYTGQDSFTWSGANGQVRTGPASVRITILGLPLSIFLPAIR